MPLVWKPFVTPACSLLQTSTTFDGQPQPSSTTCKNVQLVEILELQLAAKDNYWNNLALTKGNLQRKPLSDLQSSQLSVSVTASRLHLQCCAIKKVMYIAVRFASFYLQLLDSYILQIAPFHTLTYQNYKYNIQSQICVMPLPRAYPVSGEIQLHSSGIRTNQKPYNCLHPHAFSGPCGNPENSSSHMDCWHLWRYMECCGIDNPTVWNVSYCKETFCKQPF